MAKKTVRKKAAKKKEPTIQKPKGKVTKTVRKKKGGKTVTTTKTTSTKRKGGRPKDPDRFSEKQAAGLLFLLGKKATIAARAVDREEFWKASSKSSGMHLKDRGLMNRIDLEDGSIRFHLTKTGNAAAQKLSKQKPAAKKSSSTKKSKTSTRKKAAKKKSK